MDYTVLNQYADTLAAQQIYGIKPGLVIGGETPFYENGQLLPIIILAALLLAPFIFAGITNIVNALKSR